MGDRAFIENRRFPLASRFTGKNFAFTFNFSKPKTLATSKRSLWSDFPVEFARGSEADHYRRLRFRVSRFFDGDAYYFFVVTFSPFSILGAMRPFSANKVLSEKVR